MKLVIGGYAQGKLNYVLQQHKTEKCIVVDGAILCEKGFREELEKKEIKRLERIVVLNHFHIFVRECLLQEKNPKEEIAAFLEQYPDCIIISDEIGNGIVPVDAFEREYREQTGRLLVELARLAESVERVICGMSQKIK